ncbi:DUF389 domain-containing protein [Leptobacterium flavescens]|uniref:DUF389 domain-containing protein n=1 Tax=Leptobacterium flavescens TaxID=472055 RepID=A0A6P0UT57_9FLAO|nr:DUF389 domain-containing protein [Leptobacterium flavescens]NER15009.1 DUF389 domain-containing protein [Leptobacterium flavescens]
MEENKPIDNQQDTNSSENVKKDLSGLVGSLKTFFKELLDIRKNTDQQATIASIVDDIPFKGHTSWILICSIFIASVGLNANSTAVVIGAMLISPLMGPILGMGMSLAINDIDTLRRSLKNFGVMVGLSVLTAFLFFRFFPLRDESSELLARTAPDIRDVLIAFFGGLALVIARAKKGTIASVIFGVAIATALMPPLCTVGFGLAIGNLEYAGGAMYLFIINTIFIALATFLVLKLLRFPMVRYANSAKRRLIARIASLVAFVVMIPAGYTFYKVFQESLFKNQAKQFISENIETYQFAAGGRFLENFTSMKYTNNQDSSVELVFMGDEAIPDNVIETWNAQKNAYSKLKNTELKIVQGGRDDSEEKFNFVSELYETKKEELVTREAQIRVLEEEVAKLSKLPMNKIPFDEIAGEARINYVNLRKIGFSSVIKTNFKSVDTVAVFLVKWSDSIPDKVVTDDQKRLTDWLKLKLGTDKIQIDKMED